MELFLDGESFIEAEAVESFLRKMRGLMFRRLERNRGLLVSFGKEKRWGIWMLFVPQDLGLLFMDGEGKIVDKKYAKRMSLDPRTWKVYKPSKRCKYVLECNPEKVEEVETGDELEWKKLP